MKKIFMLILAAVVLFASQAYAVHPKLKKHRGELNDAQRFEQQLLQKRNAARKVKTKKISGAARRANTVTADSSSEQAGSQNDATYSAPSGNALFSSSGNSSLSSGMYIK